MAIEALKPFPHAKYTEVEVFQDDGDAKVVLMHHQKKDKEYVVKIIQASKVSQYVGGLSFEAYMGMRLIDHPGFAKTYRFFVTDSIHYLVIEFIKGMQFKKFLEEHATQKLPLRQFRVLAASYFHAMTYLIEKGIYPRGMHERNIIVQSNFTIKVIDFEQYIAEKDLVDPLDMGHAIFHPFRPLFALVDKEGASSFSSWEDLICDYSQRDGYEGLQVWINEVINHPFMLETT